MNALPKYEPKQVKPSGSAARAALPRAMEAPKRHAADVTLLSLIVLLLITGLLVLYSASFYSAQDSVNATNPGMFEKILLSLGIDLSYGISEVFKQAIIVCAGLVGMFFVMGLDYHKIFTPGNVLIGMVGTLALMVAVLIPGIGMEVHDARRWINLGFTTIQPVEFARYMLVPVMALGILAKEEKNGRPVSAARRDHFLVRSPVGRFIRLLMDEAKLLWYPMVISVLLFLQPNLSSVGCVMLGALVMLVLGGLPGKYIGMAIPAGLAGGLLLAKTMPTRWVRYTSFQNPWIAGDAGYQLRQSLIAIGSGGWFGAGLGQGHQKYNFLPYASSDFIFAVIAEDFGFIGCIVVILLFIAFICLGLRIALHAPDRLGALLAGGITATIAIQAMIHVAVVSGAFPTTGQPLPFFSAGGTTIAVLLVACGLLLNISRYSVPRVTKI